MYPPLSQKVEALGMPDATTIAFPPLQPSHGLRSGQGCISNKTTLTPCHPMEKAGPSSAQAE